jgi:hypothetical protein
MSMNQGSLAGDFRTSAASKAVILILGGSALLLVALFVAGLVRGEGRGYLAFALLASSVGIMVGTAISLKAPTRTYLAARTTWIVWAIGVLAASLLIGNAEAGSTIVAYAMTALSFPVGLVALPATGILASEALAGWPGVILMWAVCGVLGYLQWFVLLPKAIRRAEIHSL